MLELTQNFLKQIHEKTISIAVVGDAMIDQYYHVSANRVSPEFPIPVIHSTGESPYESYPGGAANVCHQFKHFPNVNISFFGMIDYLGEKVLNSSNINTESCVKLNLGESIPIKRRFYDGQFPLCRWDIEKPNYGIPSEELKYRQMELYSNFIKYNSQKRPDIVLFSDYDKGMFSESGKNIWTNGSSSFYTIVDPKKGPVEQWEGCSLFKPNLEEAYKLSGGIKCWREQCDYFQKKIHCQSVVITQGANGVVGKNLDNYFEYVPVKKVTADSVIGAGDCFMAFLGMALGVGFTIPEAAQIAFEAGVVYVQRKYNKPVSTYELINHIDPIKGKFVSLDVLKNRDFKLAFTNGCFDLMHAGHLEVLKYARSKGDKLVVALNSDASVKRLKGETRPIVSLENRMYLLASLEFVDFVVSFDENTPYNLINEIKPDSLIKGGDYQIDTIAGASVVGSENVYIMPLLGGISTSGIISKIEKISGSKFDEVDEIRKTLGL